MCARACCGSGSQMRSLEAQNAASYERAHTMQQQLAQVESERARLQASCRPAPCLLPPASCHREALCMLMARHGLAACGTQHVSILQEGPCIPVYVSYYGWLYHHLGKASHPSHRQTRPASHARTHTALWRVSRWAETHAYTQRRAGLDCRPRWRRRSASCRRWSASWRRCNWSWRSGS